MDWIPMKLYCLTLLAIFNLATSVPGQELPPADLGAARAFVYLGANATVAEAQIKLGQVAQISGFDEELIAQLQNMPLGQAPLPGESMSINRNEIRRQLANWRIDAVQVALAGENSVTIERRGRTVSNSEVTALVDNWVADSWRGEDVRTEINYTRLPDELALSEEDFTLRVLDPVTPRASGAMALSVAALDGERVLARFPVSIRLRNWREVAVAAGDLQRGAIISEDDINFSEREMTSVRGQSFDSVDRSEERRVGKECRSRWSPYH